MDLQELLGQLHNELASQLLKRIQSGDATASDLSVARQFLKDNGIDQVPAKSTPIGKLAAILPFDEDEDEPISAAK